MLKFASWWGLGVAMSLACLLYVDGPSWTVGAQAPSQHAYYDNLRNRPNHWLSYSLRDPAQLAAPRDGGYANSNDPVLGLSVTYAPALDTHPARQDAAKVVIPAFTASTGRLTNTVGATTAVLDVTSMPTSFVVGRTLQIDNELLVITVRDLPNSRITVARGQHGSAAASHVAGSVIRASNNSLENQVRLPLGTQDGHTYLFTWDSYWTSSYVASGLTNHKAFQFSSGKDAIWIEPRTRYDGGSPCCETGGFKAGIDVATVDIRAYQNPGGAATWSAADNMLGPAVTGKEPLQPKMGSFSIKPNKWTRFWLQVEQRPNDYDYVDYWVADETQNPVQIYKRLPVSVRTVNGVSSIDKFWIEFNTSYANYRGNSQSLVSYVRNFVALINSGDPTPFLVRPIPGALPQQLTGPALAPPTGLRLLTNN